MNISDILALSKAGFTPEQITALAPVLGRESAPVPFPAPAPDPAPAPAPVPAPVPAPAPVHAPVPAPAPAPAPAPVPAPAPANDDMPAWADKLITTIQAVALKTAENTPIKSADELANDALAQIINPTHNNGGAK